MLLVACLCDRAAAKTLSEYLCDGSCSYRNCDSSRVCCQDSGAVTCTNGKITGGSLTYLYPLPLSLPLPLLSSLLCRRRDGCAALLAESFLRHGYPLFF